MTQPPPLLFVRPEREYTAMMTAAYLRFEGCSHTEAAILLRRMLNRLLRHFTPSERLQYEQHYAEYHKKLDSGDTA
jgi:hypothetical protein